MVLFLYSVLHKYNTKKYHLKWRSENMICYFALRIRNAILELTRDKNWITIGHSLCVPRMHFYTHTFSYQSCVGLIKNIRANYIQWPVMVTRGSWNLKGLRYNDTMLMWQTHPLTKFMWQSHLGVSLIFFFQFVFLMC